MIFFVTALRPEAQALIRYYKLKVLQQSPFPIFEGEGIRLVISGMGKVAAAAATAYLCAICPVSVPVILINVGIAGHKTMAIGESVLLDKVEDTAAEQAWYPTLLFEIPLETLPGMTVDCVEVAYDGGYVYDMEASGFYQVASRFSSSELIQCFKVISDNAEHPASVMDTGFIEGIITKQLPLLERILVPLRVLSEEIHEIDTAPSGMERFLKQWHFTVSQQHLLTRLLRQWEMLNTDKEIWDSDLLAIRKSRDVLTYLEESLQKEVYTKNDRYAVY